MSVPASLAIGIDMGGTHTKIALVNSQGSVLGVVKIPTAQSEDADSFVTRIAFETRRLVKSVSNGFAGIGVSIAGLIDVQRNYVVFAPNLPRFINYRFRQKLFEEFGLPVFLEIDSNAAAIAEHRFGAGRGCNRLLCLVMGTGLGGAMLVDGEPLRFSSEGIGDPGHIILSPDGPRCTAGCRGCAEALVCAAAVEQRASDAAATRPDSLLARFHRDKARIEVADVIDAAKQGDPAAVQVWVETGHWLGLAMASLCAIFAPDQIVVAGGLAEAGRSLLGSAESAFRTASGSFYQREVMLKKAELGWQASVVGAAAQLFAAPTATEQ